MGFESFQLHRLLIRNLGEMGYGSALPIQAQALEPILSGRDLIGLAQTGMGKTAAFIVPIAHVLLTNLPARRGSKPVDPAARLRAVVLCPTRELAQQVAREAARIVQGTVLRVACAYGKVAIAPQVKVIARGIDLLVATPGRARELLDVGAMSLACVTHVVIDEADRMMDMGFRPQVEHILAAIPSKPQTLLFTATMPPEVEAVARTHLVEPVRVEVGRHTTPVEHVQQHLIPVPHKQKVPFLLKLIEEGSRSGVLVFCNTKRRVGWVGTALQHHGISVGMIHGSRSQAQRQNALDRFASGDVRVLVATDVAARGLHVPTVKTVVNYDVPLQPQEYVHRIGRAAHGGGFGEAFTLLDSSDRVRWRAILDVTKADVFAEDRFGFGPRKTVSGTVSGRAGERRRDKRTRRSKKNRPIKKGQKPGRGVVRQSQ
jgi:ATP-dependent RNA helicase RhlE